MRFTIRDVLWLTVVAALVVGWWAEHIRSPSGRLQFRAEVMEEMLKEDGWTIKQPSVWKVELDNNRTGEFRLVARFESH
jgi:hypothetical protein